MNILVVGGTRFFGIPMIEKLISDGHDVTVATRGRNQDRFGDKVKRLILDRSDEASIAAALDSRRYDAIIDKVAYSSNDVKRLLEHVKCGKYILMSTSSVYEDICSATPESSFDPRKYKLIWCERADFNYSEAKRQAECALVQHYPEQEYVAVRYPVVIGSNDYTGRLRFYVDKIYSGESMYIDDMDSRISFIHERKAGEFLAYVAENDIFGAVNGCCHGDISVREIIEYIQESIDRKALLSDSGEAAPYNGYSSFATLDTSKADASGFSFGCVKKAVFETIDGYLENINL